MRDFARSEDPAVQAQLDRLAALSVPDGRLGLETIRALCARLGDPQDRLPPTFHVAGTNGKGSTCAFLRAMLEADGKRVHVATSPHLVRYNERIRIAGKLIEDAQLAALLEEVLDTGMDLNPSFFEVTIAATFLAFAREPADACVVEVGLGGRFDATNVLRADVLAACGIAALGIDHEQFLLAPEDGVPADPIARIAFEKAGIAKPGVPLVTLDYYYPQPAKDAIRAVSERVGAPLFGLGDGWAVKPGGSDDHPVYGEGEACYLHTPPPAMPGRHQVINAGLAIAMLRRQSRIEISQDALKAGVPEARWPARMQRLGRGPLTRLVARRALWLDGGHNPSAGEAIGQYLQDQPLHLIIGMLANKDPKAIAGALGDRIRSLTVVPVPGHECHPPEAFGPDARAAADLEEALLGIPSDEYPILIAGSLYLAGEALRLNDEVPD
ncbi:bifunctional folylpolyglutamate synthase/dihydrofolate synthase [Qipengyuania mesophila]|uniref:bifunctional folylpolyglutamate synthase/dihydrofolate synthase n=1 Tax=Qipengyuania mesophila TaxID=2867246 RepID=UPI003513A296